MLNLRYENGILFLPLKITPKSSQNSILPFKKEDPYLRIKVKGQPEKGLANSSLIEFLKDLLGIPQKDIWIQNGNRSRLKTLGIKTINPLEILEKLQIESDCLKQD